MSYPPPPAYQQPAQSPQGEPPIWAPYYGISFIPAIRRALKKYADFSGRASRSEFWWWILGTYIVSTVLYILAIALTGPGSTKTTTASGVVATIPGPGYWVFTVISLLFGLALIVPNIAIMWRRLHDANFAGPFFFLLFATPIGAIVVIVFWILPSKPEGQRFDRPRG